MRSLNINTIALFAFTLFVSLLLANRTHAQVDSQFGNVLGWGGPGYYPFVIALPQDRQWLRNTPIEQRPTRPLHIYGNRVRQSYTVRPTNRLLPTSRAIGIPRVNRR